jgi:hypothetical protein
MKKLLLLSILAMLLGILTAATGEFYETGKGVMGSKLMGADTFRNNWTVILPLNLNNDGTDDIFFYDPITGEGEFYLFKNKKLEKLTTISGFRKTWKNILTIDCNGDGIDELLFYDPIDGNCETYRVDTEKKTIVAIRKWNEKSWRKSWKTFVPINLDMDAAQELFLYDPIKGEGEFLDFTADNNVKSLLMLPGFRKNWTSIIEVNLNNDGVSDLFFYDPVTGEGEFYTLDGKAKLSLVSKNSTYRKNWRTILTGNFGSGSKHGDLFFYDPVTGEGEFYQITDKGSLKALAETKAGFRKSWSIIMNGRFSANATDGLFFYESADYPVNFKNIFGVKPY